PRVAGRWLGADDLDRAGSRCDVREGACGRRPGGRRGEGRLWLASRPRGRSVRPSLGDRPSARVVEARPLTCRRTPADLAAAAAAGGRGPRGRGGPAAEDEEPDDRG